MTYKIAGVSIVVVMIIGLGTVMFLVVPDYMLAYAQNEKVTTWDECVDMYDVFVCAQLDPSGTIFNYTKPTEAELEAKLPSYEENPYFWDCVKGYKEDYDKSESISRDLCKDLLK
ncbi:MAG: hypothetical protein WA941_06045 [Nitrososphaeraceae archaeon]